MSDLSEGLSTLFANISRQAQAQRWAAEIVGTRTPETGIVNMAFRSVAHAEIRAGRGSDESYMEGAALVLSVLILAYTGSQDPLMIADVMSKVMDYWITWVKEHPDA